MTQPQPAPKDETHEIWEAYRKKQLRKKIPVKIAISVAAAIALITLGLGIYIVLM